MVTKVKLKQPNHFMPLASTVNVAVLGVVTNMATTTGAAIQWWFLWVALVLIAVFLSTRRTERGGQTGAWQPAHLLPALYVIAGVFLIRIVTLGSPYLIEDNRALLGWFATGASTAAVVSAAATGLGLARTLTSGNTCSQPDPISGRRTRGGDWLVVAIALVCLLGSVRVQWLLFSRSSLASQSPLISAQEDQKRAEAGLEMCKATTAELLKQIDDVAKRQQAELYGLNRAIGNGPVAESLRQQRLALENRLSREQSNCDREQAQLSKMTATVRNAQLEVSTRLGTDLPVKELVPVIDALLLLATFVALVENRRADQRDAKTATNV
jgi:hypothetical protein